MAETDAAEAAGGGDGLEAGDAGAHHEDLGGGDGAGGGHHHREGAAVELRAFDHGAIAGEVGLRGQHVHRLGPGDARNEFHRHSDDPSGGVGGGFGFCGVGIEQAEEGCALWIGCKFCSVGRADLEDDVGGP